MSTVSVSSPNETSGHPRYRDPPRWWVRYNVACPKCGVPAKLFCRGRGTGPYPGTRKGNHAERVQAARELRRAS
jgi:hypothetical protein